MSKVPEPCLYACEEWYNTPREVSSTFLVLGMMISVIKISVRDDWGLFKDRLEIRGKTPPFIKSYSADVDKVLSESK